MKKDLKFLALSSLVLITAFSVCNNSLVKGIVENTLDAYDNFGVSVKALQIGHSDKVDVSRTFVQYGNEGARQFIRFATAVSGPVSKITYTRTVEGLGTSEKEVTTVYKGIQAGNSVYYYDGTSTVTTQSELTDNYYWACYTIEFATDTYKSSDVTAFITVEGEDSNTTVSESKTSSFDTLLNAEAVQYIYTLDQLKRFRDNVNSGMTYKGKTIKLMADIDMNNENWTPIGLTGDSVGFQGIFDGNNKTIYNLKVVKTEAAYQSAGLFGCINGATVKNFNIENAYVSSTTTGPISSCGTSVVAGSANGASTIDNVDVKNAEVYSNRYASVVSGYFKGSITNCDVVDARIVVTPDNYTGSYDNGDKAGGIVGYINADNAVISNNTIENFYVKGYRDLGGIVGAGHASNLLNNTATNGYVISDQTENNYGDITPNNKPILGRNLGSTTLDGSNTYTNVLLEEEKEITTESIKASIESAIKNGETEVVVDAQGSDLGQFEAAITSSLVPEGTTVTIKNAKITGKNKNNSVNGTIIFENCEFSNGTGAYSIHFGEGTGSVIFNNCILNGWNTFAYTLEKVTFNHCKLLGNSKYGLIRTFCDSEFNDCQIDVNDVDSTDLYTDGIEITYGATMRVNNCTNLNGELIDICHTSDGGVMYIDGVCYVSEFSSLKNALKTDKTIWINSMIQLEDNLGVSDVKFFATNETSGIDFNSYIIGGGNTISYENLYLKTRTPTEGSSDIPAGSFYGGIDYGTHTIANYTNCTIEGVFTTYSDTINAVNCEFKSYVEGGEEFYNVFGYAGGTINLTDCTFYYRDRALKIYSEGPADFELNLINPTFVATEDYILNKALINIDTTYLTTCVVNIENINIDEKLASLKVCSYSDASKVTVNVK